ncbi:MAG: hypothetical protein JWP22_1599 [Ramlibacter sp.]|nr:hypothetical protein [Ramlibacter sp.]MDB5912924.1 hypothetical protein [Ramlibacter sp.]
MNLASLRRLLASRRGAWLLAWALCLPVAQWATATHALLHLQSVAAERGDKPAPLPVNCDLCVAAAAIGGAAPLPPPPALAPILLPHAQAMAPALPEHFLAFARAYRSRAPPLPHA